MLLLSLLWTHPHIHPSGNHTHTLLAWLVNRSRLTWKHRAQTLMRCCSLNQYLVESTFPYCWSLTVLENDLYNYWFETIVSSFTLRSLWSKAGIRYYFTNFVTSFFHVPQAHVAYRSILDNYSEIQDAPFVEKKLRLSTNTIQWNGIWWKINVP